MHYGLYTANNSKLQLFTNRFHCKLYRYKTVDKITKLIDLKKTLNSKKIYHVNWFVNIKEKE